MTGDDTEEHWLDEDEPDADWLDECDSCGKLGVVGAELAFASGDEMYCHACYAAVMQAARDAAKEDQR